MARVRDLKNNYTSGELDQSMYARSDNKHYFNGARRMRNVISLPQGGWRPRPGTAYVDTVPEAAAHTLSDTRLIPHAIKTPQTYLVMLHAGAARIYKNGVLVETLTGQNWTSDELNEVGWTQNLDTLLIFQNAHRPRAIQRQGSDSMWGTFNWELKNIPRFAFPDGVYTNGVDEVQELVVGADHTHPASAWNEDDPFTLTAGGEETSSIAYTATQATMATRIQTALRDLSITSDTGITVVTDGLDPNDNMKFIVTFGGDDGDKPWGEIVPLVKVNDTRAGLYSIWSSVTTKGEYPGEDTWSDDRGWPRCGTFFQGRLFMAGSTERPQTAWASRSGDPNDFNTTQTSDDYGIEVSADTDDIAAFHQIFVGRHLQLFASSGEFYVPISDTDPITPTNISLRRTTQIGSKSGIPVFDIEGATCFVQASRRVQPTTGKRRGVALRELIFADTQAAYVANELSLLSPSLIRDPRRTAIRRATISNATSYMLAASEDDGSMTWFCTLRDQEVNAFTLAQTAGRFTDVGVDGDDIYTVVEREVGRDTVRMLEVFVDGLFVDCGVYDFDLSFDGPVSVVAVPHLIGATVEVYVDGEWRAPVKVPGSGNVTLDPPAQSNYQVGLAWPEIDEDEATGFVYLVEDLPPSVDLQDGNTFGRKMRIVETTLDVFEMRDLIVNGNRFTNAQVGAMQFDVAPPLFTGQKRKRGMLGWGNGVVKYGNTRPGPVTVRGVLKKVAV